MKRRRVKKKIIKLEKKKWKSRDGRKTSKDKRGTREGRTVDWGRSIKGDEKKMRT